MKKIVQISLFVVLLFVLAFGVLQLVQGTVSVAFGDFQPMVGWRTQVTPNAIPMAWMQIQPMVGWNS
jgi:ABC-type polysaccharide/polyol phosphate export permease